MAASIAASLGVTTAQARGRPERDIALDCQLVRAVDPSLVPSRWQAGTQHAERFVWALRGRVSHFGADEVTIFDYRGSPNFASPQGVSEARIDWPRRVELGTVSEDGPDAHREFDFRLLHIDRHHIRARVAVTQYRVPFGPRRVRLVIGGYFGDCRVWQGEAAQQIFESVP